MKQFFGVYLMTYAASGPPRVLQYFHWYLNDIYASMTHVGMWHLTCGTCTSTIQLYTELCCTMYEFKRMFTVHGLQLPGTGTGMR